MNLDRKKELNMAISIVIFVVFAWTLCWVLLYDNTNRGTFGDMFGAVNALFSGLAFGGVIFAIILQRNELALQREELTLTRKELQRSAEAQEKSEIALSKQAESNKVLTQINVLSYLISQINLELTTLSNSSYGTPQYELKGELELRRKSFLKELDLCYTLLNNKDD
jgi:hypothetical protein